MSNFGDLTDEQLKTPMKPVQAAKFMQFPPQYIYNYLKQGAPSYPDPNGGKVVLVVISELLTWKSERDRTVKIGRPQAKAGASKLKDGQIFMYTAKPGWGVGFCQYAPSAWALAKRAENKAVFLVDFQGERGGAPWIASIYGVSEQLKMRHLRPVSVSQVLKLVLAELNIADNAPVSAVKLVAEVTKSLDYSVDTEVELDAPESESESESEIIGEVEE